MSKEVNRVFDIIELYKERKADRKAFSHRGKRRWKRVSNKEYVENVERIASSFIEKGLKKGDCVATILSNRPEWNYFDMGILMAGGVQVPVYPTISKSSYNLIFAEIQPKFIIVENEEAYKRIETYSLDNPNVLLYAVDQVEGLNSLEEMLTESNGVFKENILLERKSLIAKDDLASIIYTSGTTGNPKGVMLSHNNIVSNFKAIASLSGLEAGDKALSFLPLCHIYERTLNYMYQYIGVKICYGRSYLTIPQDIRSCKPNVFCAVPRVLEKFYDAIVSKGEKLPFLQRKFFFWAVKIAREYDPEKFRPKYKLKLYIADKLVYRKWRRAFGDRIKVIVSGSATLRPTIAKVFTVAGLPILEGYGLTEASPVIATSSALPNGIKFGTVGKVIDGVQVKLAADGEILCKGPNIMMGYYKQPELTKTFFDEEGWFHTGDIGEIVEGSYLKITDRKKEIFKTSNGKYIAPQPLESTFKESPFIDYIMVLGENRNFPSALIVPSVKYAKSWLQDNNFVFESLNMSLANQQFIEKIDKEIEAINLKIDKPQQIKEYRLIPEVWSIQTGEISPTLKLRRRFIYKKYRSVIEEIYSK